MPKFETIRRVPHSAEKMFAIVADVERYPEFLPLIERLTIISQQSEAGVKMLEADMTVGYKAFQETFRSDVTIDQANATIISKSRSGPFSHMENRWYFAPVLREGMPPATDVHFSIDYKFKSWTLEKLLGGMFDKAFRTYAESFEKRAATMPA